MNFDFTDDQYAFRDSVRSYLARHFAGPQAASPRPDEVLHRKVWAGLAELGLFGILVPESTGGLGLDYLDLALLVEELGRVAAPPLLIDTLIASVVLSEERDRSAMGAVLKAMAAGEHKIALAFAEMSVCGGADSLRMSATRQGDAYRLSGRKILVAEAPRADHLLVACRTEGGHGVLALVPPTAAGVACRAHDSLDVTAAYHEVSFDTLVPSDRVFSSAGQRNPQERLFDAAALTTALLCTGIAGRVLDTTLEYVKQRMQFGKPIGSFQALKHRCADLAVTLGSSRSAAYYASWAFATGSAESTRAISIAKTYCAEAARLACNEAIQMHGGMGFTWDQGLHLFLRRTKMLEHSYGDAPYHNERIIEETVRGLRDAT